MKCAGDEANCNVEASEGIKKSLAKTLSSAGGIFGENEDGAFFPVDELSVEIKSK